MIAVDENTPIDNREASTHRPTPAGRGKTIGFGEMKILFYLPVKDGLKKRTGRIVKNVQFEFDTYVHHSIDSFSFQLRYSRYDVAVVVLFASNRKALADLLAIRDLLDGIRIILILPDREPDTISQGYKLYPRYMSYIDGDLRDVSAVLRKMIRLLSHLAVKSCTK